MKQKMKDIGLSAYIYVLVNLLNYQSSSQRILKHIPIIDLEDGTLCIIFMRSALLLHFPVITQRGFYF